jgi:hypothetical protein
MLGAPTLGGDQSLYEQHNKVIAYIFVRKIDRKVARSKTAWLLVKLVKPGCLRSA